MRYKQVWLFALPLILAITSIACSVSFSQPFSKEQGQTLPTRTPLPTFTPSPTAMAVAVVVDEPTQPPPSPTPELPTPTPTLVVPEEPTATPTPEGVTISIINTMNVRNGPGTNYHVKGSAPAGASSNVIGRNADSSWVKVEYPPADDGTGWIYASLVELRGDLSTVPVVEAPPPPPPPTATPIPEPTPTPAPQYQFTPTGWHVSENCGLIHFKGRIRDEGGNLVNGYSVLVNNGAWKAISHPTGASHHYPEKGDGEWDVVIKESNEYAFLRTANGWWWLAVVRYECPDFLARFDAQCQQYTMLSEEVKIKTEVILADNGEWERCDTVINADWVCHWDCDKGLYTQGFRR